MAFTYNLWFEWRADFSLLECCPLNVFEEGMSQDSMFASLSCYTS